MATNIEYNSIRAAFSSSLSCNFLFYLVLLLIVGAPAEASTPLCLSNQSSALLQFKRSIDLLPDQLSSWKKETDCCQWEGVACDKLSGFVTELRIPGVSEHNSSTLHHSLFRLSHLRVLDLQYNGFNGTIPKRFAELTRLTHLDLSHCSFSGEVPTEISQLTRLVYLDLSWNYYLQLDGSILRLPSLSYIDLSVISLSYIPEFFQNFTSLRVLMLFSCGLRSFPSGIFLLPKLETLDVSRNSDLIASFPSEAIPSSSNIQYVDLSGARKVKGDLLVLSNLTKLMHLDLHDCAINGSIPSSWASERISFMDLSANYLTGSIPEGICSFYNLTELYLSNNSLSGTIPSCLLNISSLKEIDLSQNHLSSDISSSHFNLPSINSIDFSGNLLSGSIHPSVFDLPTLSYLNLDDNLLSGEIAPTIVNLTSLLQLPLSNNMLTGSIPNFFNHMSGLQFLMLRNNCLGGDIPSSFSQLSQLIEADFSSNCFDDSTLFPFFGLPDLQLLNFSRNERLKVLESSNFSYGSMSRPNIQILDLSRCNIQSFPKFLQYQDHPLITFLDLSNNEITGNIPSYLWGYFGTEPVVGRGPGPRATLILDHNRIEGFEEVDRSSITNGLAYFSAYDNHITGEIPTLICNFTSLTVLDMSNNRLTGTIPDCLGGTDLHVIGLAGNQLQGQIPALRSYSLALVSFGNNLLSGKIDPRALHNCTDLRVLDMGDNQLKDAFPSWLSSYVKLEVLILRSNHLHGPITLSGSAQEFSSLRIFDVSSS